MPPLADHFDAIATVIAATIAGLFAVANTVLGFLLRRHVNRLDVRLNGHMDDLSDRLDQVEQQAETSRAD